MSDKTNIPKHIAIIMDGNGRWAKARNLGRGEGHKKGVEVVELIIEAATKMGIEVLSLYAFSTENWKRSRIEVELLMRTLAFFLDNKLPKLIENNIKLRVSGDITGFPDFIYNRLDHAQKTTALNTGLILNLALNYGSRQEIVQAVKKIVRECQEGKYDIEKLDVNNFADFLYTKDLPEPDLLIRTSGEERLSNFMLWQMSYTELYFTEKLWPDFGEEDLKEAICEFQKRERRYGGVHV